MRHTLLIYRRQINIFQWCIGPFVVIFIDLNEIETSGIQNVVSSKCFLVSENGSSCDWEIKGELQQKATAARSVNLVQLEEIMGQFSQVVHFGFTPS